MTPFYELWLPILVSAIVVHIASSIIHMVLSAWHRNDFDKLANEDRVMEALRALSIPPGDYVMPRPDGPQDLKSPAYLEKRARGPVAFMTVLPGGAFNMGKPLALWFGFCLVVGAFAGYVACSALPPGTIYAKVFQIVGTTAFVGYTLAAWPTSIWYGRRWGTTIRLTLDGLVYALLTGGVFGWLWPQ